MTDSSTCVANIGPRGRRRRLYNGITWLTIGAGASGALALTRLPRWLRLGTFGPFALGAVGVFQAYEQTCVALAAMGARDMDTGPQRLEDQAASRQINRQARKVIGESVLAAMLLTAAALALPRRR